MCQLITWKLSRLKILLVVMDRIITLSETSPQTQKLDEDKFVSFMRECPMWEYFKISQSTYLNMSKEEKSLTISEYYQKISEGKIFDLFLFSGV